MFHALYLANAIRGPVEVKRIVIWAQEQVAPHTCGQVYNYIGITASYSINHLPIERKVPGGCSSIWISNMNMSDSGTRFCGVN